MGAVDIKFHPLLDFKWGASRCKLLLLVSVFVCHGIVSLGCYTRQVDELLITDELFGPFIIRSVDVDCDCFIVR